MLAQNFKAAATLGISDVEFEALVKVLGMLERGEITRKMFTMADYGNPECGTPACILGWTWTIVDSQAMTRPRPVNLARVFYPNLDGCDAAYAATPVQAAIALRNYLTTGEPRWAEALAE